jgi:CubicO group peptidase (beta-lactamase class C family)
VGAVVPGVGSPRRSADLTTARPLTPSTTFDVASVSEQYTATAVLLLAQVAA